MNKLLPDLKSVSRVKILLQGVVQGVGFRPFIYRLAVSLGLTGFVCNSLHGVEIEAEGPADTLDIFLMRIKKECPVNAYIQSCQISYIPHQRSAQFKIQDAQYASRPTAVILPDMATCPQCLGEIFDPYNRRYLYPFTNCTHCGPRYSIIEQLPYDRRNTTMRVFQMCPSCQKEYQDPLNRRFHAQPNACPDCGPQLSLWGASSNELCSGHEALLKAVECVKAGQILALKGVGGFQLIVDAGNERAVSLLRQRKHRLEKPLALMFPSLRVLENYCLISKLEREILLSAQAPIVLVPKRQKAIKSQDLAYSVAFNNPYLGVMLPYSPLHHLLMNFLPSPLVVTSANLSEEPMCIDNQQATNKLSQVADVFLMHDREIVRPVDDSVGMVVKGQFSLIRRARGYAPLPIMVEETSADVLALGAQMKNTVALKVKNRVYLSQHLGDLHCAESINAFSQSIQSLRALYPGQVHCVATDLHPDYFSTKYAAQLKETVVPVQHHHSHVVSCMAEHNLRGPVLGFAWDGTGLGTDQTIWGGEFLLSTLSHFERVGHIWPFKIPGGESAIRQPKRVALGLLFALSQEDFSIYKDLAPVSLFTQLELRNIHRMLSKSISSPTTTSMGRLFDGVSSLIGLCHESSYEGQAAMLLEHALSGQSSEEHYPWQIQQEEASLIKQVNRTKYMLDWRDMLRAIVHDIRLGKSPAEISIKFHQTIIEMSIALAKRIAERQIVLSGGCFQNRFLLNRMIDRLRQEGFEPYWHCQVPCNDGGISIGQAIIASSQMERLKKG